ncbi:MAG: 4-(cytidine 5'-diphospho)-2-C-methyl-D-erythritol kinase [Acidobacteria bacterium]|nr:4-(cytidine 5'-diphospho)-2-C-methyl-D-erythritol kinase [Acidobacteriota bacterium]
MITTPSFAKVNLYLRVLGREPSGYHRIETVFQSVSLHDTLSFEPLPYPHLEVESDLAPNGKANTVYQAAARIVPAGKGIRIQIRKKIPMGAGLGGGSSNAAVTLLVLNSLFGMNRSFLELEGIAAELGADVPFFLVGGTAYGAHYGERVVPLPDAAASSVVLLYPAVHVSTAEAYRNLKLTKEKLDGTIQNFCYSLLNHRVDSLEAVMSNDFESVAYRDRQIATAKRFLRRQGFGKVHLSGSGSTLFALGDSRERLPVKSGWQMWRARFVSRNQYRKRLSRCVKWPKH